LKTVSFPSISTGAFHYPKHEAAQISSRAIKEFLKGDDKIELVRLVFFSEPDADKFLKHQEF
jgi:O-acetyl-ADP-ribose deacetylase (regulator of RNase III)